ncbi:6-phosphogluconolactonase [Nocardioides solisilvae]|uniref:6-phosphogluconolactonase n=1 Tax=Nocardioides solisilvae TaxID=1542435 RepID=UPI000D74835F|nr:6-phosphogluconolactonase [Nocardioides solisilvae]
MSDPQTVVVEDAAMLAGEVASRLLARIEELQADGRDPHLVLTGGGIADLVHREVARRTDTGVDWARVHVWWGDERFVAAGSDERNARQASTALLDHVPVDPARVHVVPSADDVADAEAAASAYADELRDHGPEVFDLVMLGLGPDGHVASLFPGRPALRVTGVETVAVHDSPKPPPDRVSLTFEALNRAEAVWFLVDGDAKAAAVAAARTPGPLEECPARGVHGRRETLWLLDEAAAAGD